MEGLGGGKEIASTTLYTVIWVEFGIATLVMILRAYSQLFIVRKPSADDWVMLAAWAVQGAASAISSVATSYGLGAPIDYTKMERFSNLLKFAMISMPFGVVGPLLGRISFVLFLLVSVITVYKVRRTFLWALIPAQVIVNIIPIILQFTQCDPPDALWNPILLQTNCGKAIVVQRYGFFQGAFNALTDLVLILMGLAVIISLKLSLQNKIILCGVLSLSTLAMVAAILKTVQLQVMETLDFSYAYGMWTIWFLTEGTVVIVTASVPRLRAMILVLRRDGLKSGYGHSSGNGAPIYDHTRSYHRNRPSRGAYESSLDDIPIVPQAAKTQWSSSSHHRQGSSQDGGIHVHRDFQQSVSVRGEGSV